MIVTCRTTARGFARSADTSRSARSRSWMESDRAPSVARAPAPPREAAMLSAAMTASASADPRSSAVP